MNEHERETAAGIGDEVASVIMRHAKRPIPDYAASEEINLIPYLDVMVNIIIFLLLTMNNFLPLGMVSIYPPATMDSDTKIEENKDKPKQKWEDLALSVFITKEGFVIASSVGKIPMIPKKSDDDWDFDALSKVATDIKTAIPVDATVILGADPSIKYNILIKTMDTLRGQGGKPLFPYVQLSPGFQKIVPQEG
jgi:biopolymer transport protein ExbD